MYAEALCTEFNKLTELRVLRNISKRLKDNIHRRKTHYELQENSLQQLAYMRIIGTYLHDTLYIKFHITYVNCVSVAK